MTDSKKQLMASPIKEDPTPTAPPIVEYTGEYRPLRQGILNNSLTKAYSNWESPSIDSVTGAAVIERGGFTLTLSDHRNIKGTRTSTYQLLDMLTIQFTESGSKNPEVSFPLNEYMKVRGLKDKKSARKQVNEDLETLYNASISYREHGNPDIAGNYTDIRVISKKGIVNGVIVIRFTPEITGLLSAYPFMQYSDTLQKINGKKNPNAYAIGRKLLEHKNMNIEKPNEDRVSVKSLLKEAPAIPTYEEVMQGDRAVNRRIIEPFERDLDALQDMATWEYCHRNGKPLTDAELKNMDYPLFESLLVNIRWKKYPDQAKRRNQIKGQKEAKAIQAPKKKKTNKKK